jgi:hypothetical protein
MREAIGGVTLEVVGRVTMTQIRRHLQSLGISNPLYTESAYAESTPWGGIIAPPLHDDFFLDYGGWETEQPIKECGSRATQLGHDFPYPLELDTYAGGMEYELHNPLRPGMNVRVVRRIKDISEKFSSTLNRPMLIYQSETELFDDDTGELLMRHWYTVLKA